MNKIGIGLLSGAIGTIVGSIASYIFFKKKYEAMYYEKLQEAIDEEVDILRNKHDEVCSEKIEESDDSDDEVEESTFDPSSYQTIVDRYRTGGTFIPEVPSDEAVDGTEGPIFISEDEFRFLPPRYEIRELQYFKKGGVVLDENDELVEDPFIYFSGLESTIEKLPDESHAYILIDNMSIAVEMIVFDQSYEEVFGIGGSE